MAINTDITLRRLVAEFATWAGSHKMINCFFGYGEYLQLSSEQRRNYPAMVVNITSAPSETMYINYNVEVMFLQSVSDDQANKDRAMSDMRQILDDLEQVVSYSNRWQSFCKLGGGVNAMPAIQKGQDSSFGWIGSFILKVKKRHGICNIQALMPEYDMQTGEITGKTCAPVRVYADDVLVATVPSGDRYDYTTECDPATITINEGTFAIVESGGLLDIGVQYENGTYIGELDTENKRVIIPNPIVCTPVSTSVNEIDFGNVESGGTFILDVLFGASQVGSKVGDDLIIDVEYENGTNIGTVVERKIIVPNPIVIPTTRIYTKAIDSGSLVSYANGDTYWRKINEIGKLVQSEVGVTMRLQFGSQHLLEYQNIFGHLFRFTGLTGGYYNPATSQYLTKLGVVSTYAEVFTNNIAIDHLTSDLIDTRATASNRTWLQHCADGIARTTAGFTGWYLLSVPEATNYGNWGTSLSYNNGNPPFDWGANLKVLGDTYAGGTTQCMVVQTFGHITSTSKANSNRAFFIKPINVNTEIPIT